MRVKGNMRSYIRNHFHTAIQILFDLTDLFALQEILNEEGLPKKWTYI